MTSPHISGIARAVMTTSACLATLAGAVGGSGSVLAQTTPSATESGYARGPSAPSYDGLLGRPLPDDNETAPDLPPIIPSDDPTEDPRERDPLDETAADGQRAVVRDGDLDWPPEPRAPRDGIIAPPEAEPVRDGIDPLTVDTRPPEDLAAFENPPAGYDPLLFQIEDIDPVTDRRTRRLFRFEPYDPLGIRIGSFVLFPETEISTGWYSNVFLSPDKRSDYALDVNSSSRLVSDWNAHALEFRATSTLSYFNEFDSENDEGYEIEARGRLDITRRTNLQAFVSRNFSQESRSAIDADAAGPRADLTLDRAGAALSHRFNRLTLQLRGTVGEYDYSNVHDGNAIQNNEDRNYVQTEETVRASWEFKPTLTGFVEAAVNQRRYDTVAQSDGIGRDSDGQRYRVGVSFGNTGQILRGEIALGYGIQSPEDARLAEIDGIILDANLSWRVSELTTVAFNARSDVAETTTAGSGGVFQRSFGVDVRHAFRRHLIGTAGIAYTTQDYEGITLSENELRGDLGLEYFINRETSLFGRYRHTIFESNAPASDYTTDEFRVGMRIRR